MTELKAADSATAFPATTRTRLSKWRTGNPSTSAAARLPQEQCGACHAARETLPRPAADDAKCMSCHQGGAVSRERIAALCLHCHGDGQTEAQIATGRAAAPINAAAYGRTPHAGISCAVCHPGATAYGHAHQADGDCLQCHKPHYSEARDPHVNVDCRACHVSGGRMVLDTAAQRAVRERVPGPGPAAQTHDMLRRPSRQDCERCHVEWQPRGRFRHGAADQGRAMHGPATPATLSVTTR